jgi:hypothetical protein
MSSGSGGRQNRYQAHQEAIGMAVGTAARLRFRSLRT